MIPLRRREAHLWERDPHDFYGEPAWCSGYPAPPRCARRATERTIQKPVASSPSRLAGVNAFTHL
jgi:hypothetical protein